MHFVQRPGFLRALGFFVCFEGISNLIGLPWAFLSSDFTLHGLLVNGGLFVLPGFALMAFAGNLERKRIRASGLYSTASEK